MPNNEELFSHQTILIISPEPWEHLPVSKHHYAIELSKVNRVFFLGPPAKAFARRNTAYENLFVLEYPAFVPGLRFFPAWLQRFFMREKFHKLQELAGNNFDVVWSFDNSVFFDFSFLPSHVIKISHIVDYSQNFQLKKAARTAQICFGVSQNIVDMLLPHNKHSYVIPHGIAIERTRIMDVTLPGSNKTKAVFAGNLDRKHFDREILLKLAALHPQIDFIFFGSGGTDWKRLQNTYYPGVVRSDSLINYLAKADVLLLPYKFKGYEKELTNSHKVLDYLRSGNVIVSSYLQDYAHHENLLRMVKSEQEFLEVFSDVIANLPAYNSNANQEARREYALAHSYTQRLAEIKNLLSKVLT